MQGALTPQQIVDCMYRRDAFSQWLGIDRVEIDKGRAVLRMRVREEMCNGFGIAHGGIAFSLADSALAFAANSHGVKCMTTIASVQLFVPIRTGDVLTATTEEVYLGRKTATYLIRVYNHDNQQVALINGQVYRSDKAWTLEDCK